jgi:hypothetical protein
MKKALILIILYIFCLHMNGFATIRTINPNNASVKKVPFKPFLRAKSDTSRQECVKITLKNGNIVYGNISKLEENTLFFKQCDQPTASIRSMPITELSEITDAKGKRIFQPISAKKEKTGVFLANFSLGAILTSLLFRLLLFVVPRTYDLIPGSRFFPDTGHNLTPLGTLFVVVCMGGLLIAVIMACISLNILKKVKNKNAKIKTWISILSALILFILYAKSSIFGD